MSLNPSKHGTGNVTPQPSYSVLIKSQVVYLILHALAPLQHALVFQPAAGGHHLTQGCVFGLADAEGPTEHNQDLHQQLRFDFLNFSLFVFGGNGSVLH